MEAENSNSNPYASPQAKIRVKRGGLTKYQKAGRVMRLMALLSGVITIGIAAAVVLPMVNGTGDHDGFFSPLFILLLGIGIPCLLFFAGTAVIAHKPLGKVVGIIYGCLSLLAFPIGTIIGVYVLWNLGTGWDDVLDEY